MEVGLIILIVMAVLFFIVLPIVITIVIFVKFRNDRFCLNKDKSGCELSSKQSCDESGGTLYQTATECNDKMGPIS